MVFSTPFFLFFYLPIVLAAYYVTPLRFRNAVLLLLNLVFYGWGEPVYILIMFASIAIDYTHGMLVGRAKAKGNDKGARMAVCSSVVFNLALLFFFKYWDFIAGSLQAIGVNFMPKLGLSLPIGISFYTFQTMSYTIDVYRGDARVQKNIVTFGTFVTLFPQLIAGPIIKYKDLDQQLETRTHSPEQFAAGVRTFTVGLAKKVLIANNVGQLWDAVAATSLAELTTLGAWLGVAAYGLQIYFDFSGYSDMAIGLGRMLGFEFLENFNYPYISKSVVEFWKRWHISLTTWFREYVYFPLGGNRVPKWKWIRNILIVWLLTGIWHGAGWNFLLWGLYYGVWMLAERLFLGKWLEGIPAWGQHLYTTFLVALSWPLFAIEDMGRLPGYLAALFGFAKGGLASPSAFYYLRSYLPMILVGCVAAMPFVTDWVRPRLNSKAGKALLPVGLLAGLVLCTAYLVDATYNPFLYFRF